MLHRIFGRPLSIISNTFPPTPLPRGMHRFWCEGTTSMLGWRGYMPLARPSSLTMT